MTNMAIQWENSVIKFIVQKIAKTSLSSSAAMESKKMLLSRFQFRIIIIYKSTASIAVQVHNLFYEGRSHICLFVSEIY